MEQPRGAPSADTPILDFQPLDQGENRLLCLKHLVMAALGNGGVGVNE